MKTIGTEEHVVTDEVLEVGELRIAAMDKAGLDIQVISLTSPGLHNLPADEAAGLQVETNDRIAELVSATSTIPTTGRSSRPPRRSTPRCTSTRRSHSRAFELRCMRALATRLTMRSRPTAAPTVASSTSSRRRGSTGPTRSGSPSATGRRSWPAYGADQALGQRAPGRYGFGDKRCPRPPAGADPRLRWRARAHRRAASRALEVYNLFGTVTVIVPEGVEVVVRGGGLFASQKIEAPERPPIAGGPRVTIDTRAPGGTLYVRARQNRLGLAEGLLG